MRQLTLPLKLQFPHLQLGSCFGPLLLARLWINFSGKPSFDWSASFMLEVCSGVYIYMCSSSLSFPVFMGTRMLRCKKERSEVSHAHLSQMATVHPSRMGFISEELRRPTHVGEPSVPWRSQDATTRHDYPRYGPNDGGRDFMDR